MNILREINMSPVQIQQVQLGLKVEMRQPFDLETMQMTYWFAGYPGEEANEVYFKYQDYSFQGVIQPEEWQVFSTDYPGEGCIPLGQCPYGKPGDYLRIAGTELVLEVKAVSIERVQAINDVDAIKEGAPLNVCHGGSSKAEPRNWFMQQWDQQHAGFQAWARNPFVWVISFRVLEGVACQ